MPDSKKLFNLISTVAVVELQATINSRPVNLIPGCSVLAGDIAGLAFLAALSPARMLEYGAILGTLVYLGDSHRWLGDNAICRLVAGGIITIPRVDRESGVWLRINDAACSRVAHVMLGETVYRQLGLYL